MKASLLFYMIIVDLVFFYFIEISSAECLLTMDTRILPGYQCNVAEGYLIFQSDGNLVIYDNQGKSLWATDTSWWENWAEFQSDGNFVIYNGNLPQFATYTDGWGHLMTFQDDRNLVIYDKDKISIWSSGTQVRPKVR